MIEFKNVYKLRNKLSIEDLNLTIGEGKLVVLCGKNGKGKSSLLKLIAGIIDADAGEILIDNQSIMKYKKNHAIAYMPDNYPFSDKDAFTSIVEWMEYVQPFFKKEGSWNRLKALEGNGFGTREELSNGSKKISMYAIARSIESSLLILDEPTLGLDSKRKQLLLDDIQEYMLDGKNTVIVSSNNIEDFERICDQVIYIQEGVVLFQSSPDEIVSRYKLWQGAFEDLPTAGIINYWSGDFGTEALMDAQHATVDNLETISLERVLYYIERVHRHEKIS
ncbi:ABC transporter ATP-binding protein [Erysipelothrix sp. HDW6C]|uniref:ATP-binding cassette domain-containing protein n=1 Tax=Erysipelothrix sp. HDW6C TaxID=2714930 RepID=UPI001407599C|nr:ABC transporter ATP-binding protein [Erysipelothrix sp. HDW6C]QIK68976.1 ABC transporter ATP-binding protein [Erysipelothrix sp. HDW6C]